jgi:predicted ATPase/class 3 adenylate cyclase
MTDLPTGTVTFLFTDIEGSTRLWEQHPDAMRLALARHDSLLRAAVEAHDGSVFKTMGDQFCVAFATAPDGAAAALSAQRALSAEPWAEVGTVRVRMALHTGAVEHRDDDYFGPPLNRVARLLDAGHGGQILISQGTADLVREALPETAALRDLGTHRLKDLAEPEHLFQLVVASMPGDFPPLRSLEAFAHNLPRQLTRFIGREREMAEVKRLLGEAALLTLTGSGGCGKTRLALQVAADLLEEYPDGVWLVELAALADPALVPQTVASALGVREEPGRPLLETLVQALKPKELLLVLDNCEHLLSACAQMADVVLRSCPRLRMLASSREGLGIAGEQTYRVPSLSLPKPGTMVNGQWLMGDGEGSNRRPSTISHQPSTILQFEAVQLFADRARLSQSSFAITASNAPAVARICQRLDGIPLALELAAARVKVLPLEKLNERLDDMFRLLTGGSRTALPRQQTLRALIDWSYHLLTEAEQALLRHLSVFAGGWTLEAAEAVCSDEEDRRQKAEGSPGPWNAGSSIDAPPRLPSAFCLLPSDVLDLLTSLVEKSLVLYEEQGGEGRYRLLETVRQYARDRLLEGGEAAAVRDRHLACFLRMAEEVEPHLAGPDQARWFDQLEADHDNMRAALRWSAESMGLDQALRLAGTLARFWDVRGHLTEGRQWLTQILGAVETAASGGASPAPLIVAKALTSAGGLAYRQGDDATARSCFERALCLRREVGDTHGIALSFLNLANVEQQQGNYETAAALFDESLGMLREAGDTTGVANCLNNLANVAQERGDYARARSLHAESLALKRQLGDPTNIASSLNNLGNVAASQEEYGEAQALLEESLAISREIGDRPAIARSLNNLGLVLKAGGDSERAVSLFEESLALRRALGDKGGTVTCLANLGEVAIVRREYGVSHSRYREGLELAATLGEKRRIGACLQGLAALAGIWNQWERASRLFAAAVALREAVGISLDAVDQADHDARVAAVRVALGETAFVAAWAEGSTLTLDAAVACALEPGVAPPGEGK